MKKVYILLMNALVLTVGLVSEGLAQMPYNSDYSNWNWEDQSQRNWQRYDPFGDRWININPPFAPSSERLGEIVDVYTSSDYTKAKGWKLVWAQFDGVYPYFILYNEHQGLIRAFFYLDNDTPFSHVLATLSFHDTNNPGLLAFGDDSAEATDRYLNGSNIGENDDISVIIPNVSVQTWCSADFPILFDNNIKNNRYNDRKWRFVFYGSDNYKIHIDSQEGKAPPGSDKQHTVSGGSNNGSTFSAEFAKFNKQVQSSNDLLQKMQSSVSKIDEKDATTPKFLTDYKTRVNQMSTLTNAIGMVAGISSGFGALLGFVDFLSGTFDEQKSAGPSAVTQVIDLDGTLDITRTLGGNTLKIPGVNGSFFPAVAWNPYDCPLGYFNMEKTPTLKVTQPYARYGCVPTSWKTQSFSSGYAGKYRKYKLDEDIQLTLNQLPGMQLVDVHFAIVCKPNGTGNTKYNIDQPFIASYQHVYVDGKIATHSVPNPVYRALEEGRFIVHKYDKDNDNVVYGTPYIEMNRFKGISFEVPEDTEVELRVVAKFTSDKYNQPIVFQVDYDFAVADERTAYSGLVCNNELPDLYRYADYYEGAVQTTLVSGTYNTQYQAGEIILKPGFVGTPNFIAQAINIYPQRGNTTIQRINYNCSHAQNGRLANSKGKAAKNLEQTNVITQSLPDGVLIYPNPSGGQFKIASNWDEPLASVVVYDTYGNVVLEQTVKDSSLEVNISQYPVGLYIVRMIYATKVVEHKIVKQ